jgi:metallo-beta-lactamase family protein
LVKKGFAGKIYSTFATRDLCSVMLQDSAHIQEKEAAWQNRMRHHGGRLQRDVAPLYTVAQAEHCIRQFHGIPYGKEFLPHPSVRVRFLDAGHILGAAIVEVWVSERGKSRKLVYSGDLGQPSRPVVRDPAPVDHADVLLVESTYGNRLHKGMEATVDELVEVVNETLHHRHGNVVVPAFALGRTQDILALLVEQTSKGRLRDLNVFVDSPLAVRATEITLRHVEVLDRDSRQLLAAHRRERMPIRIRFVEDVEESKALNRIHSGAIIIASSGMCDGGRIKHHLEHNLGRSECAIVFTGFQAAGTLGRRIVDGARSVKLFGEDISVRARVHTLGGLSAHADRGALLTWLRHFKTAPRDVYVVHGEVDTARGFAALIREELHWEARAPTHGEQIEF